MPDSILTQQLTEIRQQQAALPVNNIRGKVGQPGVVKVNGHRLQMANCLCIDAEVTTLRLEVALTISTPAELELLKTLITEAFWQGHRNIRKGGAE